MRAEVVTFAASLLINAGVLLTLDQTAFYHSQGALQMETQRRLAKQDAESIAFEFVEAPPTVSAKTPEKSNKISDRDSAAQDLMRKTFTDNTPATKTLGPSDQLAQSIAKPFSMPAPAPQAIAPKPEIEIQSIPQKATPDSLASTPAPLQNGSSGQGHIKTQEMSRTRSHGAQMTGITSFEATGSGMGVYMKNLKEKIWLAWFPYLMAHYPKDFRSADAEVSITLSAKGDVKIVELVDSKGSPLFSTFCMEAVQRAGNFGAVPQEILDLIGKDELEIKFAFHFW